MLMEWSYSISMAMHLRSHDNNVESILIESRIADSVHSEIHPKIHHVFED